jgi:hypothetical protein
MRSQKPDKNVQKAMQKAIDILAEHVDTVQLFVTLHNNEGNYTDAWDDGIGNVLARTMQVQKWLDGEMVEDDYCEEDDEDEDDEEEVER